MRLAFVLVLGVFTTLQTSSATAPQNGPAITLTPCEPRNIPGPAKCGTLEVFENRKTRKGRKISINVLVLPATGDKREPDPLFYFAGGPGSAATEDAQGIAHGLEGTDCIGRLSTEFVARGTTKGLDTSCVKNIRRRGFTLR